MELDRTVQVSFLSADELLWFQFAVSALVYGVSGFFPCGQGGM